MTAAATAWRRVTRREPCPACGAADWCAWTPDGRWLKCERSTMAPTGMRRVSLKDGGALFSPLDHDNTSRAPARETQPASAAALDWRAEAERTAAALSDERVASLAGALGVTPGALRAVGVGWASSDDLRRWLAGGAGWDDDFPDGAFAFPERDGGGRVVGLALRATDGRKGSPSASVGARRALIVPATLAGRRDPVLIVEGASDVAACETLGLASVGRPCNAGGGDELARLLEGRAALVVGENDQKPSGAWPGRDGARSVAARLAMAWGRAVAWALPPAGTKDARAWLQARVAAGLDLGDADGCRAAGAELLAALKAGAREATADGGAALAAGSPVLLRLADVQPTAIRWLWPGRIALGKLTLIAGDPGLGKSFLTLDIAARVSTGAPWPDAPDAPNPAGGVVLLSAEDDPADTIRPRLDAAGADVERVEMLTAVRAPCAETGGTREALFSLTADLPALVLAIKGVPGCRLVVVDPVSAYMGRTDDHRNADVRAVLGPLADLAARAGVAVVVVSHLRKSEGPALYRTLGSLAYVAAARAAWAVVKDKEDAAGRRRLVLPTKNNLSADDATGLAYELRTAANGSAKVAWDAAPVTVSADDALRRDDSNDGGGALAEATDWLRELLADGPVGAGEAKRRAERDGITARTLDRAKAALGVTAAPDGFRGPWAWRLPSAPDGQSAPSPPECAKPERLAHCAESGALCGDGGIGASEWGEL